MQKAKIITHPKVGGKLVRVIVIEWQGAFLVMTHFGVRPPKQIKEERQTKALAKEKLEKWKQKYRAFEVWTNDKRVMECCDESGVKGVFMKGRRIARAAAMVFVDSSLRGTRKEVVLDWNRRTGGADAKTD